MKNCIYTTSLKSLKKLRLAARIIAILFILPYSVIVIIMGMMFNKPAAVTDYLILSSCSIYVIGLLIAFKYEGLGGLISLLFVITALIYFTISTAINSYAGNSIKFTLLLFSLILPPALFLLYWTIKKKTR